MNSATRNGECSSGKGLEGVHRSGAGDDVEHDRRGDFECGASERKPKDATEMVFVLGGVAGFDGVVPRVMGTRGDFVDVYCTCGGGERGS